MHLGGPMFFFLFFFLLEQERRADFLCSEFALLVLENKSQNPKERCMDIELILPFTRPWCSSGSLTFIFRFDLLFISRQIPQTISKTFSDSKCDQLLSYFDQFHSCAQTLLIIIKPKQHESSLINLRLSHCWISFLVLHLIPLREFVYPECTFKFFNILLGNL